MGASCSQGAAPRALAPLSQPSSQTACLPAPKLQLHAEKPPQAPAALAHDCRHLPQRGPGSGSEPDSAPPPGCQAVWKPQALGVQAQQQELLQQEEQHGHSCQRSGGPAVLRWPVKMPAPAGDCPSLRVAQPNAAAAWKQRCAKHLLPPSQLCLWEHPNNPMASEVRRLGCSASAAGKHKAVVLLMEGLPPGLLGRVHPRRSQAVAASLSRQSRLSGSCHTANRMAKQTDLAIRSAW